MNSSTSEYGKVMVSVFTVILALLFILIAADGRGKHTFWRYDGWHKGSHVLTPMFVPTVAVEQLTEQDELLAGTTLKCRLFMANRVVVKDREGNPLFIADTRLECNDGRVYRIKHWVVR